MSNIAERPFSLGDDIKVLDKFSTGRGKTSTLLKPIGDVALRSFKIYIPNIR